MQSTFVIFRLLLVLTLSLIVLAQNPVSSFASFGKVISLGGAPSDLIVDELRERVYVVQSVANRIVVWNYRDERVETTIGVGQFPLAGALSLDGSTLYVTNTQSSSLSIVDLENNSVRNTVSLPARPEGVAVGNDGRVLITTQGAGLNNQTNTLLLFDPRQEAGVQLSSVPQPPAITTAVPTPGAFQGRPATAFPGRLLRTPDGNFIIGMVAINQTLNNAQTTLFVFETASGTVLRNRTVTGQSTILSMSADGARILAGSTLYDTATLAVLGQMSVYNLPFLLTPNNNFNLTANFGGSTFSPNAEVVYAAFNNNTGTQANGTPNPSISNTLLVANSRNLGVRLGIRLPENILGVMAATADGANAWAVSDSGLLHLPLATLFDYPILQPETNTVFLSLDPCNKAASRATVRVSNLGRGRLTFSAPNPGTSLVLQVSSGVAPSTVSFVMEPGRAGVTRLPGTNVTSTGQILQGTSLNVTLASNDAINIPNTIKVFMNFRLTDQRGLVFPVPTVARPIDGGQNLAGLYDMVLDEGRKRLYISNAGFNRVEIFDTEQLRVLEPLETSQLPRTLALSLDGGFLYVANSGGEMIEVYDLETRTLSGRVDFPPIARNGTQALITPVAMAMTQQGLQFAMSNGGLWRVIGNAATPRQPTTVNPVSIGGGFTTMASSRNGDKLIAVNQNGTAYVYEPLIDAFITTRQVWTNPQIQSYFGPLAVGPDSNYLLAGGMILSPSLVQTGGAERPGQTTTTPGQNPFQPPQQTVVSAGQRNVAAVYPLDQTRFARMTTPVRQNILSATRDDARTTIEIVDVRTQAETVAAVLPENPVFNVFANGRANIPSRHMVVDANGMAYVISTSGLTVAPTTALAATQAPRLPNGARGIVNANDNSLTFRPGSFITINGLNLASAGTADALPLPTLLGGVCATMNDVPLPLLQTSPTQISAQIPDTVRPGQNIFQLRSLMNGTQTEPLVINVSR
jgi:YVTN family beta-propeller protein